MFFKICKTLKCFDKDSNTVKCVCVCVFALYFVILSPINPRQFFSCAYLLFPVSVLVRCPTLMPAPRDLIVY